MKTNACAPPNDPIIERVPTLAFGRKENKFSFRRAVIWSAVACKCLLDKKCLLHTSAVRDVRHIWTHKDRKFIFFTGHSCHRSSNLSWLRQVSEFTPVTPNIALSLASVRQHLVDRTLVRRKIFKPTPKIFGVT